jgi:hypothetical protein
MRGRAEEHAHSATPVNLNNGEKWMANAETTEGIHKMSSRIAEFTAQPKTEDYHALSVQLEDDFNNIIQRCTMTGEAHEQLHRFLIPIAENIKQLKSESIEICSGALDKLNKHLAEYENYFQ